MGYLSLARVCSVLGPSLISRTIVTGVKSLSTEAVRVISSPITIYILRSFFPSSGGLPPWSLTERTVERRPTDIHLEFHPERVDAI